MLLVGENEREDNNTSQAALMDEAGLSPDFSLCHYLVQTQKEKQKHLLFTKR